MSSTTSRLHRFRPALAALFLGLLGACGGGGGDSGGGSGYVATALITDVNNAANPYSVSNTDAHLVNAWGVAFNPQGFVWVADNGTSTSTLYDGNGVAQSLVVAIPAGTAGAGKPTGLVFNGGNGFVLSANNASGPSPFIFAGESGTIAAWSPGVDLNNAHTVHDGAAQGAIYKGLAISSGAAGDRLYATDFHKARVDVFDGSFAPVAGAGAFVDPTLPAGYAPFGIQTIGANVYVAYAKQDAQAEDETAGAGLGIVSVFDTAGVFIKRLVDAGGALNAPWGMALAPANFGRFSGDLLVGNFGNGRINAFDPVTFEPKGHLKNERGKAVVIDGLWGIGFGNGAAAGPTNVLYFAAGPEEEEHGLFGRIDAQ